MSLVVNLSLAWNITTVNSAYIYINKQSVGTDGRGRGMSKRYIRRKAFSEDATAEQRTARGDGYIEERSVKLCKARRNAIANHQSTVFGQRWGEGVGVFGYNMYVCTKERQNTGL